MLVSTTVSRACQIFHRIQKVSVHQVQLAIDHVSRYSLVSYVNRVHHLYPVNNRKCSTNFVTTKQALDEFLQTHSRFGSVRNIKVTFQSIQCGKLFRASMAYILNHQMDVFEVRLCDILISEAFCAGHTFGTIYQSFVEFVWFEWCEIVFVYLKSKQYGCWLVRTISRN